jgi:opacity protein-like surface antigen
MNCFKTKGLSVCVVTLCLLGITSQARADVQTIRGSDSAVWGSMGASFLNYKEEVPSPYLPDSEHGFLPSFAGGVSILGSGQARDFTNNLYFSIDGSVTVGEATYNGAYLATPLTPLQSNTHETIWTVDGKLGHAFVINPIMMLIPYVEVGYRYWDRNLGGGQVEDYQHADTLGGLMVQVSPINRLILTGYGSAGTTLGSRMTTEGDSYSLTDSGIYKIGAKVGYDLTQRVEVFTTLDYDAFRYGQSSVQPDGTYEPTSKTEDSTVRVGLSYHFR